MLRVRPCHLSWTRRSQQQQAFSLVLHLAQWRQRTKVPVCIVFGHWVKRWSAWATTTRFRHGFQNSELWGCTVNMRLRRRKHQKLRVYDTECVKLGSEEVLINKSWYLDVVVYVADITASRGFCSTSDRHFPLQPHQTCLHGQMQSNKVWQEQQREEMEKEDIRFKKKFLIFKYSKYVKPVPSLLDDKNYNSNNTKDCRHR